MRVICAWCQALIKEGDAAKVSHGICPSCARQMFGDDPTALFRLWLDKIAIPVMAVNELGEVIGANQAASALVRKSPESMVGLRGGQVIDCVHAFEGAGCGHTAHCQSCILRNTVMATHSDGLSRHTSSPHSLRTTGSDLSVVITFSTQRIGPMVLLTVEG